MSRKKPRNPSTLSGTLPCIAVLIAMIALVAFAQTKGARNPVGESSVAPASPNLSSVLLAQVRPSLSGGDSAERGPVTRRQRNALGPDDIGPGAPFFVPPVFYPLGGGIHDPLWTGGIPVALADMNGDGKLDLLVGNGGVALLLGNGDGTFQPAVTFSSGGESPLSLVIADLNGDGKPDVVAGTLRGVGVLLGNGDGTFQPWVITGSGGTGGIAVADMNGDGKLDVVAIGSCNPQPNCPKGDNAVTVLEGQGDGTFFASGQTYDAGGIQAKTVVVADLNGDGKPDVAVADQCVSQGCTKVFHGVIGVLLGKGDLTFQPVVDYPCGDHTTDVAIADVNGDGKPDLLEIDVGSGAGVLLGNGDGTFQARVGYSTGGYTEGSLVLADVNGDGRLDMVVGNEVSGTVAVLPGNSDGTFQSAVIQASNPGDMAVADLNGDGRLDLVFGTTDGTNPFVGVMMHVGDVPTTTTVTSSLKPSVFGQSVTFTAKVTAPSGTPQGTVVFYDGLTALGSATLVKKKASVSLSTLESGTRSIYAVYQGSLKFNSGSSAPLQQVVNPATTTSSVTSSPNPALIHEVVMYAATVVSQFGGAITGTVVFEDGGTPVATVTLAANQAVYGAQYKIVGVHAITATYSGDANNTGSVSATLTEQINKGFASKTALTTSGSPSHVGQPVTFTATVTSKRGVIPDGEVVTFSDGLTAMGTGTTTSGVAAFTTSSLSAKTHRIKASYGGDAIFEPSLGQVTQVVEP